MRIAVSIIFQRLMIGVDVLKASPWQENGPINIDLGYEYSHT
jgi:hypothetical protein